MRERDSAQKPEDKAASPVSDSVRVDALITLLIEKGLITRDELGKMNRAEEDRVVGRRGPVNVNVRRVEHP